MIAIKDKLTTDTWVTATWNEFIQIAEDPAYQKARCYAHHPKSKIQNDMSRIVLHRTLKKFWLALILLLGLVVFALWQYLHPFSSPVSDAPQLVPAIATAAIDEPIQPIPLKIDLNLDKVKLGEKLFNDPQLSGNNTISCASCHFLKQGGDDNLVVSVGIEGRKGTVNALTVFNTTLNFRQFWDGRAETLSDQIDGPILAENEMGSSWPDIVRKLKQSPDYVKAFQTLYTDGVTRDAIKDAIATFETSLTTPNSRVDKYLRGDKKALSLEEKEGYRRFKTYGCVACHQGVNVGGNMFQSFGLFGDYFQDRGQITQADYGRYNVTGKERDRFVFKVPSLRNVALTAPYFHDGSAKTLVQAVQVMAKYQLGRELSDKDIDLIIRFLIALTGNVPRTK
jgi:cytochrome c peroxidase